MKPIWSTIIDVIETLINYLTQLSNRIPVELFILVGSFIEEVVAPIPSPLVTTVTGSLAYTQGYIPVALCILGLLAAISKTIGSVIIYFIADKAEDFLMIKIGPYIGITHKQIENIGAKITGTWKDYFIFTFIRILPFVPSMAISISSGIIKVPMKLFLIVTFIGTFFRSMFFIIFGYISLEAFEKISKHLEITQTYTEIALAVGLFVIIALVYYKRWKK